MTHKAYSARIEFDADDSVFFGRIASIRDVAGFHADTVGDRVENFHEAVVDYITPCAHVGKRPNAPIRAN